ncbi:SRPBCC family protein [Leisingera sp. ANG-S5]|uniref:SRPBCC family protein n=1 Tax=Leisingera sp. ANG-S5 TaxID=1577901 RepID=UPI00057F64B0|nr:SRPBCC family protein [Leisingera sp. ANG-S5]KIC34043.1 DNA polymerase III subunit gamma/tau [Leisingera sp. ANG-S5]
MEFHSKEDIEAPIAEVFAAISDFGTLERSALRRGIELQRTGDPAHPENGLAWDLSFSFRGKPRAIKLTMASYTPPSGMALDGSGSGVDGRMEVELLALSPQRTRMSVRLKLSPTTLTGRLLVQSLKLARSNLNRRFKLRLADYARLTEERLSRTA